MKYVLDSSVAFKTVVAERDSSKAIQLLEDFALLQNELIAPDVFPYELAHALTRAERQQRIVPGEASILWATIMGSPPHLLHDHALIGRGIEIASYFRIGVYDCVYVALAERENCELVTADAKLVLALGKQFPFIVELSTFP